MPRPKGSTKYTKEMDTVAETFLSEGYSLEALAGELGIAESTIHEWLSSEGEYFKQSFSESVKKGLAKGRRFWEGMGIDLVKGNYENGSSVAWIFNMKNRYGWADKSEIKQDVTVTNLQDFVRKAYEEAAKQRGDT